MPYGKRTTSMAGGAGDGGLGAGRYVLRSLDSATLRSG